MVPPGVQEQSYTTLQSTGQLSGSDLFLALEICECCHESRKAENWDIFDEGREGVCFGSSESERKFEQMSCMLASLAI